MNPNRVLRQIICAAIAARQAASEFVVNDFVLSEGTYLPSQSIENAPPAGSVWVIGLAADDFCVTRSHAFYREMPIQIALQKVITEGDPAKETALLDLYEDLVDQLRDTLRLATRDHEHFAWQRTEPLRDENGLPFAYSGLRESHTFEAFFTGFYKVGLR